MIRGDVSLAGRTPTRATSLVTQLANQAFSRASGAPLREHNRVRLLKDAAENYRGLVRRHPHGATFHSRRDVHHP